MPNSRRSYRFPPGRVRTAALLPGLRISSVLAGLGAIAVQGMSEGIPLSGGRVQERRRGRAGMKVIPFRRPVSGLVMITVLSPTKAILAAFG